ncbi:MAG: LamG-like jellyroll fold domain-containing protein [Bacteroidota bacterium]
MKLLNLFLLVLIFCFQCNAQIESTQWLLPNNNVISFNPEISVTAFPETITSHLEGAAVVMNSEGEILFIATGTAVYDKNWNIIKNGEDLADKANINAAESPAVLQKPGSETEYYVFYTADHSVPENEGDLNYSIVNICDENNEISIAPNEKNVLIPGDYSERLELVEIDRNNYWLLTTAIFEKRLLAFKITNAGISDTPVETFVDNTFDGQIGKIALNNSKTKLAWSSTFTNTSGVSLYDFDINTGQISNQNRIHSGEDFGLVWLPNDSYLYFTDVFSGSSIYSYSLQDGTLKQLYQRSGNYQVGDLRMSPFKDRIIVNQTYNNKLGQIIDIESGGNYSEIDIDFLGDVNTSLGLQQQVINYGFDLPTLEFTDEDLMIADGETFTEITVSEEFSDVVWSDGQIGNIATFYDEGIYSVEVHYNCQSVSKEFEIEKITVFEQECDYVLDDSNLEEKLLLKVDFTDPFTDDSNNEVEIINTNVVVDSDRFEENSAGRFGEDRFLNLGHHYELKPDFPMSFSFWVYPEELGLDRNYIYTSDLKLNKRAGFAIQTAFDNDRIHFFYSDQNGCYNPSCRRGKMADEGLLSDKWTHVSIVAKSFDDIDIYYDGCLVPSSFTGFGNEEINYSEFPSYIGFADNSGQNTDQRAFWGGKIDDFYFWNRPISEEEVLFLYDRFEVPEIELESIYTIPIGQDDITISLPEEYIDIAWSNGQTGNTATFSAEGEYQVKAFYNCNLVCQEFVVEMEIVSPPSDTCVYIQHFDNHCGTSQYRCVVSSEVGYDKYYFEGQILLPEGYSICTFNLNDAITSAQEIYVFEMSQSDKLIDFRAFATILDADEFYSKGLVLEIDVCRELEIGCISYVLPYGTCSSYYDCTIDYKGISYKDHSTVDINYCMVLHDFNNDDCALNYSLGAYLMNSTSEKLIFKESFTENLDSYQCISIPLSIKDFLSNEYNCIELRAVEECSGRSCHRYDCNLFNSSNSLIGESNQNTLENMHNFRPVDREESSQRLVSAYPNPTTGRLRFQTINGGLNFELYSSHGELMKVPFIQNSNLFELDMEQLTNGVYYLIRIVDGQRTSQKIVKIE